MTAEAPAPSSRPTPPSPSKGARRFGPLILTLAIVVALIIGFFWFSGFYADALWFTQLGFQQVLYTRWIATIVMFLIGFVAMAVPTYLVLMIAYRTRPTYARLSAQLGEYQRALAPIRRVVFFIIPLFLGIFAGLAVADSWQGVLQFFNATPFGVTDPEFGLDVGFYVFQLPFWRGLVSFSSAVLLTCLVLGVAASYLYGGIRITGREIVISKAARILTAVLAASFVLVQGVSFWLDRYRPLTGDNGRWSGALYTDVHARIPGLTILAGVAVIVALLFLFAAIAGRWTLPLVGVGGLIVVSLVVSLVFPWLVQSLQVVPNEQQLETEYIKRNIDATRTAYGLDNVEEVDYSGVTTAQPGQLRSDAETTANIRIMDPALISKTFAQFEQERAYYQFGSDLDVDRYTVDGQTQDAVTAVREINVDGLGADAQSWVNRTIVYTHGYGLVASYGSKRGPDGQPLFMEAGMPQTGVLGDFQPRVYFGENMPQYSIVGAPADADPVEFDHISGTSGDDNSTQTKTTFTGSGGPSLGNWFNRLVYAIKFQSEQILLSDAVNSQSQILYDRNPAQRVRDVAPYLTVDSDPYASVVDGQLVWILDGYTTTDAYPYASTTSIAQVGVDSTTTPQGLSRTPFNYLRNSVKATVNAYDGSVTLYAWDPNDPILQTWQKIFPNTLKPIADISGDLMSHVRYPQDLFKVQRAMLSTYHVTDANEYYNQTNAWQLPADPTSSSQQQVRQPPYYLTMRMPGQEPAFSIYSTFIPMITGEGRSRNVLTGYLSANANAGNEAGKIGADYGRLTVLRIQNNSVNGPGQVQNIFSSNQRVAEQLNLLARGGTEVLRGNLLTLPVGDGFLYVQPVYVQSTGETQYPLLRRVLAAFGDKIAFEDTLDAALDSLFLGDAGASAGDEGANTGVAPDPGAIIPDTPAPGTPGAPDDTDTGASTPSQQPTAPTPTASAAPGAPIAPPAPPAPGGSGTGDPAVALQQAINDASQALQDRTDAYARNDLVAAAEADARMTEALQRADAAQQQLNAG